MVADTKEPRIQEIDSDEEDSDDAPDLQETGADGTVAGAGASAESKQSRSEKKSRKAVAKLGMKQIFGIHRITVKKAKSMLFVIQKPDVFKAPYSDTYVVFGEFKGEDTNQMAHMQALAEAAAKSQKSTEGGAAPAEGAKMAAIAEDVPTSSGGGEPESKDVELVMAQANCTKEQAIEALKKNNNDIVEAIMGFQT